LSDLEPATGAAAEPVPDLEPATGAEAEPVPDLEPATGAEAELSRDADRGPDTTTPDLPALTVPLAPLLSFAAIAPLASTVPVPGLDASQAGLALAGSRIGTPAPGMTGILGQDHLRADLAHIRFLFPRLEVTARQAWWIWRGVAAAVSGAAFAALTSWPFGVAAGALVVGADVGYRFRTSPAFLPTAKASSAQRRTRRRLARLGSLGYLSLHERAIPGTASVIDHLVVGPAGIYAVDSEVWDRRLPVRATRGGKLFHGPRDQAARLEHAQWEAGQAARLIGEALGQPVTARPAMVIYGPTVPWIVVRIGGVDVFCGRRLGKYLRREAHGRSRCLDDRQIEAIHEVAARVLPSVR
jgi:Nuclease-related domain